MHYHKRPPVFEFYRSGRFGLQVAFHSKGGVSMKITWEQYAANHHLTEKKAHHYFNVARNWLEQRGIRLNRDDQYFTDHEWAGAVEQARRWWNELLAGTFADWE